MGEPRGFHHHHTCPPRFMVEQSNETHTGGRESEQWIAPLGAEPCEERPCERLEVQGLGEAKAEGRGMLRPLVMG